MIEADNASTSIYQVLRMSRAAMTHLLIIRMSSIWPRMAEDILTTRPGTYQQDVLQSFLSLSIMVKWMTDANNASNVISEVKRTPLAAMTDLLISTKGALRRPITYITAVKCNCTDGVTKCPKTLQIMPLGMISNWEKANLHESQKKLHESSHL